MKSLYRAFMGLLLTVCLVVSVQSCKPSIPSQYLSEGKMEDVLYDIHIAQAMSGVNGGGDNADMIAYREAVFKKHGITSADFDSSMVYYMRHTKLLHDIYEKLGDRLTAEAQSLGIDVSNMNQFGDVASGDTTNVWKDAQSMVFSTNTPFNYHSFEVPVDTGYHKGDKLILDFEAQFLFQDGMRDGIAMLAVTFQNDSVASSYVRMTSSQHYTTQVEDRDSLGIKSIKGYFLLNKGDFSMNSASMTTLKMMFLQHIKLIRMHASQKPVSTPAPDDNASPSTSAPATMSASPSQPAAVPPPSNGPRPVLSAPMTRPLPAPDKLQKVELKDETVRPKR